MDPPSRELLTRYEAGDAAAARQIYDRYAARLLGLARRMLADKLAARVDPDDVVQSAYRSFFLKAREGRYDLRQSGDLWRLLLAITRHKVLHEAERQTAAKRTPGRETFAGDLMDEQPAAEDVVAVSDELQAIMAELTPEERLLLELRLREESSDEIAARLGKSPRTVRRLLLDLRRKLERRLGEAASRQAHARSPAPAIDRAARLDYREFRLEQMAGAGAFGKVYRAFWTARGTTVAVKALRKQFLLDSRAIESFLREARTVAELAHPGVIRSYGLGRTPAGGYFLVFDWQPGGDLARRGTFTTAEIETVSGQAADALSHVHERGIVHCDLKPSNFLLSEAGSVVLTDFGFAQAIARAGELPVGGTEGFVAPELVRGERPTPAADVFSLGRVLFWMLQRMAPPASSGDGDRLREIARACIEPDPTRRCRLAELRGRRT